MSVPSTPDDRVESDKPALTRIVTNTLREAEIEEVCGFDIIKAHGGHYAVVPKGHVGALETFEPGDFRFESRLRGRLEVLREKWESMPEGARKTMCGSPPSP